MKITKHVHACVVLEKDGGSVLIDPGTFEPDAARLIGRATAVLLTHEHFDHVHGEALDQALESRADLSIWGPSSVTDRWSDKYPDRVHAVRHGDAFEVNGFSIAVHGELHAQIHPDVPRVVNVGYLVDESLYHPGDAYYVPRAPVATLLVPTSGPWTKFGEAVDFVRGVAPERAIQIHEVMLSDVGQQSVATFLSPKMLTDVALTLLPPGDSLEV